MNEVMQHAKYTNLMDIDTILQVQNGLQAAMGHPCGLGEVGMKENILALVDEAMESLHEINWKPWKRHKQKAVDRDALLLELCDILQFWGNAVNAMGFSAREVRNALITKWDVGFQRVDDGETTHA